MKRLTAEQSDAAYRAAALEIDAAWKAGAKPPDFNGIFLRHGLGKYVAEPYTIPDFSDGPHDSAAELTAFGRAFQGEVRLFEACPDNEIVEGDALECVECHANICICEECQAEAADGVVTCHSCDREEATRE